MAKRITAPCRVPGCRNMSISRGLCAHCRKVLEEKIEAGEITEKEAIEEGWIKPRGRGGAPRRSAAWNYFLKKGEQPDDNPS